MPALFSLARQNDHLASSFYSEAPALQDSEDARRTHAMNMIESSIEDPVTKTLVKSERPPAGALECEGVLREKNKMLQCAERQVRCLRDELCLLQRKFCAVRPVIDPRSLHCAEAIASLLLCLVRKAIDKGDLGAFGLAPELLIVMDSVHLPLESLTLQRELLRKVVCDPILRLTASRFMSRRFEGGQFPSETQLNIIQSMDKVDIPYDLKYLCVATADPSWQELHTWWKRSPLSLRWLTISHQRRIWLAYNELYLRAPQDLRWLAVCFDDPRWLHFCASWRTIPIEQKMKAIRCGDLNLIRTSEFHGPPFELWDCPAGEEMLLIPSKLRGSSSTKLVNRCVCCPIHCQACETHDLRELRDLRQAIESLVAADAKARSQVIAGLDKEREALNAEWQKKLTAAEKACNDAKADLLKQSTAKAEAAKKAASEKEAELLAKIKELEAKAKAQGNADAQRIQDLTSELNKLKVEEKKCREKLQQIEQDNTNKLAALQKEIERLKQELEAKARPPSPKPSPAPPPSPTEPKGPPPPITKEVPKVMKVLVKKKADGPMLLDKFKDGGMLVKKATMDQMQSIAASVSQQAARPVTKA